MSSYPNSIDGASTLYTPVDAFSAKLLETTASAATGANDSTISVASTSGGFADAYGVLSIDDELVVYAAKTGTQFTGCQRGAFGTGATAHQSGVPVKANMVAGFLTALQSAVTAIETELGTVAARNYVRASGDQTVTGNKTFQDGASYGTGNKAGTGLVRLPNTGAIKWRKADNSGDLGMALNANNHLAMDAILDFAPGQNFGAFSYPDATTTSKGIVQVDPVGGLAVTAGVLGLGVTGVAAGTYTKLSVDAKGRVTSGSSLGVADLPAHTHVATDIVSGALPFTIQSGGAAVGTRRAVNLIQGANVTLTVTDDGGNDRVNVTIAATSGSSNHNLLSIAHPDTMAASPVLGDLIAANGTPAWTRLAGNTTTTRKFLRQAGSGSASALPTWDTLLPGDLPAHTHAESDVTSLVTDLAGKAPLAHSHDAANITTGTLDNARTSGTANATVNTLVLRDGSGGANFTYAAANNLWAYLDSHLQSLECGAYQTIGGPFENMAKYSEDFSVAAWDKNGGSCSVSANATAAPDGNTTADQVTASSATPVIQQQVAGLASGGQYTFYVWARVASGTVKCSLAIVDNPYAAYLAGPTQITVTTSWQRFKITGTLAGGQTGLWIVFRQFAGNGDSWTAGSIYLWGACLQQGNDPKRGYARTWGFQTGLVAAGVSCGAMVISAKDNAESPLRVYGPGSNLADHTLLAVNAAGELTVAGGAGNGYMFSALQGAANPSGWSGVIKVKNPAGATAGYILLYSNP